VQRTGTSICFIWKVHPSDSNAWPRLRASALSDKWLRLVRKGDVLGWVHHTEEKQEVSHILWWYRLGSEL
jgi:hypothetical protein